MAAITITIPDAILGRVLDGMAGHNGYQSTIPNPGEPNGAQIPNPETKAQFAKRKLIEHVKSTVQAWESNQAAESARLAAIADVNTDITLT